MVLNRECAHLQRMISLVSVTISASCLTRGWKPAARSFTQPGESLVKVLMRPLNDCSWGSLPKNKTIDWTNLPKWKILNNHQRKVLIPIQWNKKGLCEIRTNFRTVVVDRLHHYCRLYHHRSPPISASPMHRLSRKVSYSAWSDHSPWALCYGSWQLPEPNRRRLASRPRSNWWKSCKTASENSYLAYMNPTRTIVERSQFSHINIGRTWSFNTGWRVSNHNTCAMNLIDGRQEAI